MKFTAAACLSVLVAPAFAASIYNGKGPAISTRNEDLNVPGDSPLQYCQASVPTDIVQIDEVDLSPNPPQAGKELEISAKGTVKQRIEKGAYAHVTVKYGLIKLLTQNIDLCEQISNVDLHCPLEPGELHILKNVDLPSAIPPGTYNVVADVFTADEQPITCLTASVNFPRPGAMFDFEL